MDKKPRPNNNPRRSGGTKPPAQRTPAQDAQADDVALMLGEIFSSPRTWLGLAAIAGLVFVFVKLRR